MMLVRFAASFAVVLALFITGISSQNRNSRFGSMAEVSLPGWDGYKATTQYDVPFRFECPHGQALAGMASKHSNKREDRVWALGCRAVNLDWNAVKWVSYVNDYREDFNYKCPIDSLLTGIYSIHTNEQEDRRFMFRCTMLTKATKACEITGWLNAYDKPLFQKLPATWFYAGMASQYSNKHKDRRFNMIACWV